ncbi:MAG: hypothetical protein J0H68_05905 [Sphingobacteriia bacterium]|nr:hypothetical protein [Sphingobacteriia bacterium]
MKCEDQVMEWQKLGLVFHVEGNSELMNSHTSFPKPFLMEDRIRIFFASRSTKIQGRIFYIDVDIDNPTKVIKVCEEPVLGLGELGTFDDCGITPDCVLEHNGKIYLYYHGWNVLQATPFRSTVGLAISENHGENFKRYSLAPLFDRTNEEPIFSTNPYVMKEEEGKWHMWYMVVTKWLTINGKLEGLHTIYYASSTDGINWNRENVRCIEPNEELECIANPCVIRENGVYKMWYCSRKALDFRDGQNSYRMGYAESRDGKNWVRMDDRMQFDVSNEGWDSLMVAYPAIIDVKGSRYMFYNGNGFGKTGIGCAKLVKSEN